MMPKLDSGWMAYVGLGANLPFAAPDGSRTEPEQTLRLAVGALRALGTVTAGSHPWRTAPEGPIQEQLPFINGAVALHTVFSPKDLMQELLAVEQRFGRLRSEAKGPRTLDLDMLLAEEVLPGEARLPVVAFSYELMLPHPEMDRRRFVLEPLAEIAPGLRHPLLRRDVRAMLRALDGGGAAVERLLGPALGENGRA